MINNAIAEVRKEFSTKKASAQNKVLFPLEEKMRAFKMSNPVVKAHGRASLKFEKMVRLAEKKIIENDRKVIGQDSKKMAQSILDEFFHKPGTILTREELQKIHKRSKCLAFSDPQKKVDCNQFRPDVRTLDGTCNNLHNPNYGAAETPFRRLIPPRYEDGVSSPRGTLQMEGFPLAHGPFRPPLPSPRIISLIISQNQPTDDVDHTHMLMQWGQFVDHDMGVVPAFKNCPRDCTINEECAPFPVLKSDSILKTSDSCHMFGRSMGVCPQPDEDKVEPRQQFNGVSHFIDASTIYSDDKNVLKLLRNDAKPRYLRYSNTEGELTTVHRLLMYWLNHQRTLQLHCVIVHIAIIIKISGNAEN